MGLCNDPICRKCGTEEETSVHILCECEMLASLMHAYLGSFFLDLEDIRVLGIGATWNFAKVTGVLLPSTEYGAQRACQLRPRCIRPERARTQYYSILFYDHISPGQELQTHIQTDGNDIRPHTAQTHNERTSTESKLVTAKSTAHEPPEDGRKYGPKTCRGNLTKMFLKRSYVF
jgi:hypothetical protein